MWPCNLSSTVLPSRYQEALEGLWSALHRRSSSHGKICLAVLDQMATIIGRRTNLTASRKLAPACLHPWWSQLSLLRPCKSRVETSNFQRCQIVGKWSDAKTLRQKHRLQDYKRSKPTADAEVPHTLVSLRFEPNAMRIHDSTAWFVYVHELVWICLNRPYFPPDFGRCRLLFLRNVTLCTLVTSWNIVCMSPAFSCRQIQMQNSDMFTKTAVGSFLLPSNC